MRFSVLSPMFSRVRSKIYACRNTLMKLAQILGHDFFADLSRVFRDRQEQPEGYISGTGKATHKINQ
jgi:hypothetical protein